NKAMKKTAILDITKIEPQVRHSTILAHFEALDQGEDFIMLNDQDPKPLYYSTFGEQSDRYNWEYLEADPGRWRVRITKSLAGREEADTIGRIVAKDIRKAEVFMKLGIDFCCGGKRTLREAAEAAGVEEQ